MGGVQWEPNPRRRSKSQRCRPRIQQRPKPHQLTPPRIKSPQPRRSRSAGSRRGPEGVRNWRETRAHLVVRASERSRPLQGRRQRRRAVVGWWPRTAAAVLARRGFGREGGAGLLLSGLEIWASGGTVVGCWACYILGLNMGMTSNMTLFFIYI